MSFVDIVSIQVKAGHGGAGAVSFRREKYVARGGPDGGKGGDGGAIILKATRRLQTLMDLKIKRQYKAKPGDKGKKKNQYGSKGKDTIIEIPCGSLIFDEEKNLIGDLKNEGDNLTIAKGGKGGLGNAFFATSSNRVPRHSQPGMPGEEKRVTIELRMIADVGLVGLPNAGKSTLLKTLTKANPKIASYPFTTLYPNLGVIYDLTQEIVIADIPGLIEGASEGQGLGDAFLRHVDRTALLLHLVELDDGDADSCLGKFMLIEKELSKHNLEIHKKPKIVVLTKLDIISDQDLKSVQALFKSKGIDTLCISSATHTGIGELKNALLKAVMDNENETEDTD